MATQIENEIDIELDEPKKYKVVMLNDDYTTMDFVVEILKTIFKKSQEEATKLMLLIHEKGSAVCGVYPYEIALTKIKQVEFSARKAGFPLKAILEEE